MLDRFIYGSVERIPPKHRFRSWRSSVPSNMPGGAANVARNVAALGSHAILIGVVGADEAAANCSRASSAVPLRTQLIVGPLTADDREDPSHRRSPAGSAHRRREPSSRYRRSRDGGARAVPCSPARGHIVFSRTTAKGCCGRVTARAIAAARQAGSPVLVDPKNQVPAQIQRRDRAHAQSHGAADRLRPRLRERRAGRSRRAADPRAEHLRALSSSPAARRACRSWQPRRPAP